VSPSREDPRGLIRYALGGAALTVVLLWTLYLARGALLLIYLSALVAIGLGPVVDAIERRGQGLATRRRVPRWLAILTIYLSLIGVLVGIGMLIFPPLASQARELWSQIPRALHEAQQWLMDRGWLNRELSVQEAVQQAPGKTDAVGTVIGALSGVVGGVLGVFTILILAFYLLLNANNLVSTFVRLFPREERPRVADACRRVSRKVSAWLCGQMLLGGIIAATAALGLYLMGVPYFYVLALIAGVGELVPIVGPLLAAIPAIAVALTVSPTLALGVAVFYIAQQQFENHVLVPKVMERQVGVNAAVVVIALLLGGSLLGVVGAIMAVPTAAILQVIFEELAPEPGER
jgi:predicted PurR-regulated permease PerM